MSIIYAKFASKKFYKIGRGLATDSVTGVAESCVGEEKI
jgi:hypothetical protein